MKRLTMCSNRPTCMLHKHRGSFDFKDVSIIISKMSQIFLSTDRNGNMRHPGHCNEQASP